MSPVIQTLYGILVLFEDQPFLAVSKHGGPLLFTHRRQALDTRRALRPHLKSRMRVIKLEVTTRAFPTAEKALSA